MSGLEKYDNYDWGLLKNVEPKDEADRCGVCDCSLSEPDCGVSRTLKCSHSFHVVCLNSSLMDIKYCPVCKENVKWWNVLERCSLCFESFAFEDTTVTPPCAHEVHLDCLKILFETTNECNVCSRDIGQLRELLPNVEIFDMQNMTMINPDDETGEKNPFHGDFCAYCTEPFRGTLGAQKTLECGHTFHKFCFNMHVLEDRRCVICRAGVDLINENPFCVVCRKKFEPLEKRLGFPCHHTMHRHCKALQDRCPDCKCKREKFTEEMACPFCKGAYFGPNDTYISDCNHRFHLSCVTRYIGSDFVKKPCPICFKDLREKGKIRILMRFLRTLNNTGN